MNTRTYTLKSRAAASQRTRDRILTATRTILASDEGVAVFSLEAVARAAGVTRVTVYNQFGSKRGLVEALSDDLAVRAEIGARLGAAFRSADALEALDTLIDAFAHFWTGDRVIIRRLHGIAALDPDIGRSDADRNRRRRDALTVLLRRLQVERGLPQADALEPIVDLLQMLTSFEAMDQLAGDDRTPAAVAPVIRRLAREALGVGEGTASSYPVMSSEAATSPPSDPPPTPPVSPLPTAPSNPLPGGQHAPLPS